MTRVLLTGASGFIGSFLAKELHKTGYEVIGTTFGSDVRFLRCDLTDPRSVAKLPPCEVIIHTAQSRDYKNFPEKANSIFNVNVSATQYLLDYARSNKVKKFIYISSGSVYDLNSKTEIFESSPIHPKSYYALTKLLAEQLTMSYSEFFQCISLRLFNPFSHAENGKLISNMFDNIEKGKEIFLAKDIGVKMNPLYLKDLSLAIIQILKSNTKVSDVFNLAGPQQCSLKDLALMYAKQVGAQPNFVQSEGDFLNMVANVDKLKQTFGFNFEYTLEKAVQEICAERKALRC